MNFANIRVEQDVYSREQIKRGLKTEADRLATEHLKTEAMRLKAKIQMFCTIKLVYIAKYTQSSLQNFCWLDQT